MTVNLGGLKWKLKGFWPYEAPSFAALPDWNESKGITDWIDASVPGCIHDDLHRAGLIPDPNYAMNTLECEWVEKKWWIYRAEFTVDELVPDDFARRICINDGIEKKGIARIKFSGVDYECEVYLNGKLLCEHSNLFEPFEVDITGMLNLGKNFIAVVIKQAPEEEMQLGRTTKTKTQKPRFAYKWDFCSRLVNIGIWDEVVLDITGLAYIENVFVKPLEDNSGFDVTVNAKSISEGKVYAKIEVLQDGELHAEEKIPLSIGRNKNISGSQRISVKNPKLWNPSGHGEQNLYDIRVTLYCGDTESDHTIIRSGIRTVKFVSNEKASNNALMYTLIVNGKKIYMKGINWVPADHLYGRCSRDDYKKLLTLARDMNVNIIRVWGGGLIEKEHFYSLCDELGIMVWQDFIQSASGKDYWPCIDEAYLEDLKKSVVAGLKKIRNHPCHVVYTGGNELMYYGEVPVGYDNENIAIINQLVNELDPGAYFLPSTPSGPISTVGKGQPLQSHDIHGAWSYLGEVDHYKTYGDSDNLLHSEFGVQGMCSPQSACKFMPPEELAVKPMSESPIWRFHGDWWCCYDCVTRIFGIPKSFENFVCISQFIQGEGLRFIIDSNRRRAYQNSGCFVWQFNEPYPNISCTSLVDYYRVPKQAYFFVRRSYSSLRFTLFYKTLIHESDKSFSPEVWCFNDGDDMETFVDLKVLDIRGMVLYSTHICCYVDSNKNIMVKKLNIHLPQLPEDLFFVRLENDFGHETWMFSQNHDSNFKKLLGVTDGKIEIANDKTGYVLTNTGTAACVGVMLDDPDALDSGMTIFPGEQVVIPVKSECKSRVNAIWINR